jgi:Cytochrome c7 and related cytochrome c
MIDSSIAKVTASGSRAIAINKQGVSTGNTLEGISLLKTMIRYGLLLLAFATLAFTPVIEKQGADEISLFGGKRGNVPFPHRRHQDILKDCSICHTMFPREKGIIDALKKEEKLKAKQVMNKLCVKCHRTKAKAGEPSGPRSCNTCHIKETPTIPVMR